MDYYYYEYAFDEQDSNVEADYEYPIYMNSESLKDIYYTCIVPSTTQITKYIMVLLSCSLSYHLLRCALERLWPSKDIWCHLSSIAFGFLALYLSLALEWLIILCLCLITYVLIVTLRNYQLPRSGMAIAIFTIVVQMLFEYYIENLLEWQKVRGVQMVATMKMISFAYDFEDVYIKERTVLKLPQLLSYLGYIFCPTTCILGPWIPYSSYIQKQKILLFNAYRLLSLVTNIVLAVLFLNSSNCLIPWTRSKYMPLCMHNYFDALSVRCSQYFIGFLSQATLTIEKSPEYKITQPLAIEFPRSLHSLVRYWNVPMHQWLKLYMFRPLQSTYGNYFISLSLTYVVSALLHGFHTEVHLVLLSLAGFTYVENVLRSTLARVYDACIEVNGCSNTCSYAYCPRRDRWSFTTLSVRLVNFMFSALAVINLTYLGVIMSDSDASVSNEKYGGLLKWHRLKYFSHWINLALYIFYLCI